MRKLKINREYMRLAIRFLNDLGLLKAWGDYIEDRKENPRFEEHHRSRHWSNKEKLRSVFGETKFTEYLEVHHNIAFKSYQCAYEVFETYCKLLNREGYDKARKYAKSQLVHLDLNAIAYYLNPNS